MSETSPAANSRPALIGGSEPHSRELQLLLNCAAVRMGAGERVRISELLNGPLDTDYLLTTAWRHGLIPLLAHHVAGHDGNVSAPLAQELRLLAIENMHRVLRLSGELLSIISALRDREIVAVPYKGPVLGAQLYGNMALRQAGDLDLLIDRSDVRAARSLILERGYSPRHMLRRGGESFMLRSRYSEVLEHKDGTTVELHWAFTNGDVALPLSLADLLPRLEEIKIGQTSVPVFAREDLLIILCVHGSKHRWDRIEWLCGVAEAAQGKGSLDWNLVIDRAGRFGVRRMLLLGLLLAHAVLRSSIPEAVLERARADSAVSALARQVPILWSQPLEQVEMDSLPTDLFRFKLRERRRDRLRFLWYRLTTPSRPEEWSGIRVGTVFVPLHGFSRVMKLLRKVFPAVRSYQRSLGREPASR